jgi:y4mF family transcriptional regulator
MTDDQKTSAADQPDKDELKAMLHDRPQTDGASGLVKAGLLFGGALLFANAQNKQHNRPRPLFASGSVDNVASLGKAAWQRRKDLGLTQEKLAQKSGVGVRFISEFENGKSTAEIAKVFQLLDALNLQMTIDTRS